MIYLKLFWAFFQIGLFSIGGGYAAMPMIQSQVVSSFGWLTMAEFADVVTISEMTPGPITLNAATFVGTQVAGIPGALAATFGCIVPSCIIVTTLAVLYKKFSRANTVQRVLSGLRPVVVGLIASAALTLVLVAFWGGEFSTNFSDLNLFAVAFFAAGLFLLKKFKPSPIYILLGSGLLGLIFYGFLGL